MAAKIQRGREGKRRFVRQQDAERAKPYTSCRIVVGEMQCIFAGLEFPDDTWFVETVRKATGVPEVTPAGKTQGTSAADFILGMSKVLPWVRVDFRAIPWDDLHAALSAGEYTAGVAVEYYDGLRKTWILPASLRRSSPSFRGRHQILLNGGRVHRGRKQLRWVNCLDPRGSQGKWLDLSIIKEYFVRSGSATVRVVYATTIGRSAGMKDAIMLDRVYPAPAAVSIPKGTALFRFDAASNELVKDKPAASAISASGDCTVKARKLPAGAPTGTFVRLTSPAAHAGKYARTSQVSIVPAPPGECAAVVEAAVAPLQADIRERDAYIQAVRAIPVPDAQG